MSKFRAGLLQVSADIDLQGLHRTLSSGGLEFVLFSLLIPFNERRRIFYGQCRSQRQLHPQTARPCSKTLQPSVPKRAQAALLPASHHTLLSQAQALPPLVRVFPGWGGLRGALGLQPWEVLDSSHLHACWLRKQKTCNCFLLPK